MLRCRRFPGVSIVAHRQQGHADASCGGDPFPPLVHHHLHSADRFRYLVHHPQRTLGLAPGDGVCDLLPPARLQRRSETYIQQRGNVRQQPALRIQLEGRVGIGKDIRIALQQGTVQLIQQQAAAVEILLQIPACVTLPVDRREDLVEQFCMIEMFDH